MAKLTIFRGLPGSGKSTKARELAAQTGAILIEPDVLLIEDGVYNYTPERYAEAKRKSLTVPFNLCEETDFADLMCDMIYADVLPRLKDVEEVIDAAQWPDEVVVIDCVITPEESKLRNRHNVRHEDIDRMAAQWQPWFNGEQ